MTDPVSTIPAPSQPETQEQSELVKALREAERAFDKIRRTLINSLNEPERSGFWEAVRARIAIRAALSQPEAQEGDGRWEDQAKQAASVITMIRAAIGEMFGSVASIESPEATLLRGPEAKHDGEAILEALQRIAANLSKPENGWRSMDSAPKGDGKRDGPSILVHGGMIEFDASDNRFPSTEVERVNWSVSEACWIAGNYGGHDMFIRVIDPLGWQPLPAPPASALKGGE